MLGSIYIGLSGMDAYSKGLQTISNNVANMNSLGFKAATVNFSDVYQYGGNGLTYSGDQAGQESGNGVRFTGSGVDFRQGTLRQTEGDLDLSIQGGGFLVLQSGANTYYTRTGQFSVDEKGYISLQGTEHHLTILNSANQPTAVNLDDRRTSPPVATTHINFADNLSSTATTASVSNIAVYDSNGGKHVWQVTFNAVGAGSPGQWNVVVTDETGATIGGGVLKFNASTVDASTSTITVNATPATGDPLSVALNFSAGVSSFSGGTASTIRASNVDGNGVGALSSVTVDETGQLKLTYSNTKTELLGAIALADFRDPQLLQRVGNSLFENTKSANYRLLPSGVDGIGKLLSKQVETSNVDLSKEFGDLILIQRGFQASSQVVSVSNDMIQELFGIRGRG